VSTFIIDCPVCKAKVAAEEKGRLDHSYYDEHAGEPFGERILLGSCPSCQTPLVGRARQIEFKGFEGDEEDVWSDVVRVFPSPPKTFSSHRIPRTLSVSLREADRSLQAGANIAACVMLARALEALCRDHLEPKIDIAALEQVDDGKAKKPKRPIMLASGIRHLLEKKIIDERLFDWSQSLNAVRNLTAHPEDITVSREDAEDLQAFVYAITEYVYDLTDRYNEFKEREEEKKKPRRSAKEMFADIVAPGR
jgi:hypothetical protein